MPPKKIKKSNETIDNKETNKQTIVDNKLPHIRDIIIPKDLTNGSFCKIVSWNVAGLRAVLRNNPKILDNLVNKHNIDILCLQETKLQSPDDIKEDILSNYNGYWVYSEKKKGYSGVVIFIKKSILLSNNLIENKLKKKQKQLTLTKLTSWNKSNELESIIGNNNDQIIDSNESSPLTVNSISYELEDPRFTGEGRTITIDLGMFYLVGCYVPNSGQNLERLDYRVNEWDPYMREYLHDLKNTNPVIFFGDLNVGHLDLDIHNPTAKHIVKQSGLTPQERNSMTTFLSNGFTDAFRFLYPDARGAFTYWSQRTQARPFNKGIRLDYFICSNDMFANPLVTDNQTGDTNNNTSSKRSIEEITEKLLSPRAVENIPIPGVYDSYILHEDTVGVSDHCPVVLVVKLE